MMIWKHFSLHYICLTLVNSNVNLESELEDKTKPVHVRFIYNSELLKSIKRVSVDPRIALDTQSLLVHLSESITADKQGVEA